MTVEINTYAMVGDLRQGKVKSCGCLRNERAKEAVGTHHSSKEKLWYVWNDMRYRCEKPLITTHINIMEEEEFLFVKNGMIMQSLKIGQFQMNIPQD